MKLSEIIDVFITGDWGNESPSLEAPHAVSCVRGADIVPISNNEFVNIPLRYVSEHSFQQKLLQVGDIVIEKSGGSPTQSTGRAVYISQALLSASKDVVCSNFCVAFRVKEGWNSFFIYQYWQYLYNSGVFFNFEGKTSGIKNLQLDIALSTIEIEPYPIEKQISIANCLETFDEKIAFNRSINHNLEAMAKQLYDYWFVQFDFPDENGKPYKSSGGKMVWDNTLKRNIPEKWHCGNLFEIAKFTNGIACQKFRPKVGERALPVIKIREMRDGFTADTEVVTPNIPNSVKVFNGDILFSWSASLEVMLWAFGNGGLNQHIFKVTSTNDFPKSFYYFQLQNYVGVFKKMAEARKTTMGHITQDHLQQSAIAIPDDVSISKSFEEKVYPIFDQQVKLQEEIQQLTKQRDTLLPLLMNGQATVNYDLAND
ncbi:restriction endonuclease subunit S [Bacteroides fragilis]|nr:restriction endonuclease subunit S [Bacteroides fragilis]MCS3149129.1 restriction endonuclease subunit S [Bacteroides fragilis]UVQ52296.1 restriction endonuclease subunit S [Bacteroides fragilis]